MTHSSSPYTLYNADRYRRDTPVDAVDAEVASPPVSEEINSAQSKESVLSESLGDVPVVSVASVENIKNDPPQNPTDNPVNLEKNPGEPYSVVAMTGEILTESTTTTPPALNDNVEKKQEILMTPVPLVSSAIEPASPKTPGAFLKQRREQKRLSIEHIADKLCLHQGVIVSLEADNYEVLPPCVFVRGYFRAYADLLDTPIEPILALYAQQQQDVTPPPLTLHHNKNAPQASSTDPWFKVGTFILFLSIMVLMTLWKFYPDFQQGQTETVTPIPPSGSSLDRRLPGEDLGMASQPLIGIQAIPLSANSSNESGILVYTPPGEEEASDASESTAVAPTVAPTTTPTPPAETPAQPPVSSELKIKVTRESWMQVNDKEGKQLFLGTAAAGRTLSLEGKPPYQIRVGNLDGVSVEYQGTTQALSAYPRGEGGRRLYVIGQASE